MKAVVYCSRSAKGQESFRRQESACRARAIELGHEVVDVERIDLRKHEWSEGLFRLLDKGRAGEIEAIIAYSPSHISPDPVKLRLFADKCQEAGLELDFVNSNLEGALRIMELMAIGRTQ